MESVSRWGPEILEPAREINVLELAHGPLQEVRRESLREPLEEQIGSPPVTERLDHAIV
jgi:hypothetical protein